MVIKGTGVTINVPNLNNTSLIFWIKKKVFLLEIISLFFPITNLSLFVSFFFYSFPIVHITIIRFYSDVSWKIDIHYRIRIMRYAKKKYWISSEIEINNEYLSKSVKNCLLSISGKYMNPSIFSALLWIDSKIDGVL